MIVAVAYKYTANPQDMSIDADGVVGRSQAKSVVFEYDPMAIQLDRNLVDVESVEPVNVIAGKSDVVGLMVKKNAMPKGLDREVVVVGDAIAGWNAMEVASALAGLVKSAEGADVLLAGGSSIDEDTKIVPALTAGFLRRSVLQGVSAVVKTADGYEIIQNVPDGSRMIVVPGSVVILASSDATAPKIPSMKDILAAGKRPVEKAGVPSVDVEAAVVGRSKPERRARKNKIFEGVGAPAQLVAALCVDGAL